MTEIQALQLYHQHLTVPADVQTVLHDMCGLQAQYFSNACHALKIRSTDFGAHGLSSKAVKSWTLRGTMHLFSCDDLPLFFHRERKTSLRACDTLEADEHITKERKRYFADCILETVSGGVGEREKLKVICRQAGMTEEECLSVFNSWGGTLRALCEQSMLCYEAKEEKIFRLCPPFEMMNSHDAEHELITRYFAHYGPATIRDAACFFGVSLSKIRRWMETASLESFECDGSTFWCTGIETNVPQPPECVFLAGFDPLMMGYEKKESLYLPQEHLRKIFLLSGIVMPALLLHGRVVGKWKKSDCKLKITLFESISEMDRKRIATQADMLWNDLTQLIFE